MQLLLSSWFQDRLCCAETSASGYALDDNKSLHLALWFSLMVCTLREITHLSLVLSHCYKWSQLLSPPRMQSRTNPTPHSHTELGLSLSFPTTTLTFPPSLYSFPSSIKKMLTGSLSCIGYHARCWLNNGVFWKEASVLPFWSFHSSEWMKEEGRKHLSKSIFFF